MKILYLVYFDLDATEFIGVKKKVLWQLKGMNIAGLQAELVYKKGNNMVTINGEEKVTAIKEVGSSWYRKEIYNYFKNDFNIQDYNAIYIRVPGFIDYFFFQTIKMFHEKGLKVILELPTYPIGREYINHYKQLIAEKKFINLTLKLVAGFIHKRLSRRLNSYVKYIVTFMPFKKIWGIDVIEIDNGVSLENVPLKNYNNQRQEENNFVLIGVANVDKWHGFDRVIKGIAIYNQSISYANQKVIFKIIGDGREIENLKKLSYNLNVSDNIEFLGRKDGKELNELFNNAKVAISSVGMHRIGVLEGSTLKTKEYCARGLPFIYGYKEKRINDLFKQALKVSADESPIEINEIMTFYNQVSKDINFSMKMREFAEKNFSWDIQMKPVVNKILRNK